MERQNFKAGDYVQFIQPPTGLNEFEQRKWYSNMHDDKCVLMLQDMLIELRSYGTKPIKVRFSTKGRSITIEDFDYCWDKHWFIYAENTDD